jgi:hypothetical protein
MLQSALRTLDETRVKDTLAQIILLRVPPPLLGGSLGLLRQPVLSVAATTEATRALMALLWPSYLLTKT